MPSTVKGPGILIAQFAGDEPPFNTWPAICRWAADLGYKGIQLPAGDPRFFHLQTAAESKTYCDEIIGVGREHGICDHRALYQFVRPARRCESGLRRGF